jgi:hypothetical protein
MNLLWVAGGPMSKPPQSIPTPRLSPTIGRIFTGLLPGRYSF